MKVTMVNQFSIQKVLFIGLFLTLGVVTPASGQLESKATSIYPAIHLKVGTFTPALGERLRLDPRLTIDPATIDSSTEEYYIVQFSGPIRQPWLEQVSQAGGEIMAYIPDYALKARMTPETASTIGEMSNVIWIGLFQPGYKLSPDLSRDGLQLYKILLEADASDRQVGSAIQETGVDMIRRDGNLLVATASSSQLDALAHISEVAWIENFRFFEKHNEYAAGAVLGSGIANANGYDGSSQVVAVADTGLGGGTPTTAHADIPSGRITGIQNFSAPDSTTCYDVIPDGAQDVDSGHGTHTTLSVVGDGGVSGEGKGTAPAAKLVFQAVEEYVNFIRTCAAYYDDGYYLIGLPTDLTDLFQPAYSSGAHIHSNSWGSDDAGDYTTDSATADAFTWNNPDFLITFSAGNAGTDANSNGVIDNDSIGSPATAKNVLTVGASENDRLSDYPCDAALSYTSHDSYQPGQTCSSMGGQNLLGTYGQRWPSDYPANPITSDITAGNKEQMAAFSSRGPTDDGRIKPDVVAPGTWVLSGYSNMYQEGYGDPANPRDGLYQVDGWGLPMNDRYKYFGGTSMSNPLAAGAAAVVRDYYNKKYAHNSSAALVKATLINTAVDLLDENNDGVDDNDYPIPNFHEGWGRIDLVNATDGSHEFMDYTPGLETGTVITYVYHIASEANPLKVSLVWSDYPSTAAAALNLVNNLNLEVSGPGGYPVYRGNIFSGGWSQTGGSADSANNVENVYVQSPAIGAWTISITAANVPFGPQPFALVVDGDLQIPTAVTDINVEAIPGIGYVLLNWGPALDFETLGFNVYRGETPDGPRTLLNQELIPSQHLGGNYVFRDSTAQPGAPYLYWIEQVKESGSILLDPFIATAQYGIFLPIIH
jgi:serine protease AprX